MAKKVVLLATGGTISTSADKEKGGLVNKLSGEELIKGLNSDISVEVRNFSNVTSVYITPQIMFELAKTAQSYLNQEEVAGVVVTNGTSTLEETSFFLDMTITGSKPVVITGSQRSGTDPWPDGPENIEAAVRVASDPQSANKGVVVVFSGVIHEGKGVNKVHTYALDPFDSGDKGSLGYVYPDKIVYYRERLRRPLGIREYADYPVEIIKFYAGADERFLEFAISQGVKGIVIEALGLGNVNESFYKGIKKARENGIEVIITSRCYSGRVMPKYAYPGGGVSLQKLGAIFAGSISSPKARLLLKLALNSHISHEKMQDFFDLYCQ
jgi:L-asparaginase